MMRRVFAAVAAPLLAVAASACDFPDSLGPAMACNADCLVFPTNPYMIGPDSVRILRGDTVRFISCENRILCGWFTTDAGNTISDWRMPGTAVAALVTSTGTDTVMSAANSVLVRAFTPGEAQVTARSVKLGNAKIAKITVADSADITVIEVVRIAGGGSATLRRGQTLQYSVYLKDAMGRTYDAVPTAISVADSEVLMLTVGGTYDRRAHLSVFLRQPGNSELRIQFLGVTKVLTLTVLP